MSDLDERAPARRLAELSQKIAKVTAQLEQSGELTSARQEMARTIHSREIALRAKVDAAMQARKPWRLITAEFERDFQGLSHEFTLWLERLGAETVKHESD